MRSIYVTACVVLSVTLNSQITCGQINIPGALLIPQGRPGQFRQQRIQQDSGLPPQRFRRPPPSGVPAPIRPVIEETEEVPTSTHNSFEDEVTKLGISALQSAVRQAEDETTRPVHFRPERPIPVLRENIRENLPVLRQQEPRENYPRQFLRQQQLDDIPVPIRQAQPIRQSQPRQQISVQPAQPVVRQRGSQSGRQPSQHIDDDSPRPHSNSRARKPVVQILRKYRTDNADGSITWGFENEDGTFKEETLGVDCVARGKYGYVDPDGVRRDYTYEAGNKCDQPTEEELELEDRRPLQSQPQPRKPQLRLLPQQI